MKRNIRKIPRQVIEKLNQIEGEDIVVACALKFSSSQLRKGILRHLGIRLSPKGLTAPASKMPPADRGRYSRANANGQEIIRKGLPKVTHYTTVETPNWGDPYKGYHAVDLPHECFQREFKPPQETEIVIQPISTEPGLPAYAISFKVNHTLRKGSRGFKQRLFENLNLLQESVGACSVEAAQTPLEKYTKSLHLSWEILPPGTRKEAIERLFRGRVASKAEKDSAGNRYDFFRGIFTSRHLMNAARPARFS